MTKLALPRSKKAWLAIVLAVLAIGAIITWSAINNRTVTVNIPQRVLDKTLFTVYVPSSLPARYHISENSFSNDDGVLVFALQDDQGHSIAVTEQSSPASFDFTDFYNKQIRDPKKVTSSFESVVGRVIGQGATGITMLSVRADSTWIIATTQNAAQGDLEYLASHLRKFN
jgi:hypothetical protein